MARGRKPNPVNYQEELNKVDLRIIHHQNSIKELESKKETLMQKKTEEDISTLTTYLTQNNLSASDIIQQLQIAAG